MIYLSQVNLSAKDSISRCPPASPSHYPLSQGQIFSCHLGGLGGREFGWRYPLTHRNHLGVLSLSSFIQERKTRGRLIRYLPRRHSLGCALCRPGLLNSTRLEMMYDHCNLVRYYPRFKHTVTFVLESTAKYPPGRPILSND